MPASRHLELGFRDGKIIVGYERCLKNEAALRLRKAELLRKLKRQFGRFGRLAPACGDGSFALACGERGLRKLQADLPRIDRMIDEVAQRPFTTRMVLEVLDITSVERARWSKDGRLPKDGSASVKAGRVVRFSTYAARDIARLAEDPSIICAWREADRLPSPAATNIPPPATPGTGGRHLPSHE